MATVTETSLRQRLARVEALERGATTPGERAAAARARERLMARIVQLRASDPVARFVAAHVASLGVSPARPAPPARLPTEGQLVAALLRWRAGDWGRDELQLWAERIVDRVVLPTDPEAEGAAVAEVLLQLAMLHRVALQPRDVGAICAFLGDRDWRAWFALVAAASERRYRRG
ncbi:MAG TPA: hypothetical protein ENK18_22385 [Deltaproteobacteria bacterium]|nr:hypothetical protein [Deltaproteobacteria bacterium]